MFLKPWARCGLLFGLLAMSLAAWGDGSKLATGDLVGITVDGEQELSKAYQINRDGCITMPMVGAVKVADLSPSDAAAAVSKSLQKILVNPQVTVVFMERVKMQVFVVGEVKKSGLIEIGDGDRVIQALAAAGYDDTVADLSRVAIHRGDTVIPVDLTRYLHAQDLTANRELQSGDTIVVPSKVESIGSVQVAGQATKTGSFTLTKGMTFKELMGLIGGATVEADTEKISIKHEKSTEQIPVKYKEAMDGDPTADLVLQPNDLIYIPRLETSFYTVIGGVNRPGQFPVKGKMTLSEAIGEAGGPTPGVGDMRKVQLMRAADPKTNKSETLNVDLSSSFKNASAEPLVERGDVIMVAVHTPKTTMLDIFRELTPLGWLLRP